MDKDRRLERGRRVYILDEYGNEFDGVFDRYDECLPTYGYVGCDRGQRLPYVMPYPLSCIYTSKAARARARRVIEASGEGE